MFTNSSKDIWLNKKVENPPRSEKYFPSLMAFVDCTGQQIARPADKNRRKMYYSSNKKRHTVKINLWLTTLFSLSTKQVIRNGVDMIMMCIKRITLPLPKRL
jgi:hypothetical protein